ncbi:hypothetical protein JKF63_01813 [Porcisia hertigi]|uniref:Tr-type G domain-containing protein n=1 Tax=Porcisia hertigi TaxID=2761500 RepID=A0A836I034_9TRYP|nr:hypothetical protein JKF63_01813 [Porcisia hertigi]
MLKQDVFRIHVRSDEATTGTGTGVKDHSATTTTTTTTNTLSSSFASLSAPPSDFSVPNGFFSTKLVGNVAIAAAPSALSPPESLSRHDGEAVCIPAGEQEIHPRAISQQHILAERAHASFRHDRRLKRGQISPGQAVVHPSPTSHSPHSVMNPPVCLQLPESVVARSEKDGPPRRLHDSPSGGNVVSAFPGTWRCSSTPVTDYTTPQPCPPSAASTSSIATAFEHSTVTACHPLSAEDDEGDVEYKWRLTDVSATRFQHLVTQMQFRVSEGHGQSLYQLGVSDDGTPRGLTRQDFNESVQNIYRMAAQLQLEATLLQCCVVGRTTTNPAPASAASLDDQLKKIAAEPTEPHDDKHGQCGMNSGEELLCGEIMLSRRQSGGGGRDLSVAFCGAVGSGKSTLMAVLLTSRLDDGCGGTRQSLFNHKHELDTGRTSSLASRVWTVLQEPTTEASSSSLTGSIGATQLPSPKGFSAAAPRSAGSTWSPVSSEAPPTPPFTCASSRSITLLDAGGDITKTMLFGLMSRKPDYVCLCVAADTAVVSDVSLYAEMCCAMGTPFLVVVTKCDLVEEFELDGLIMELAVALDTVGFVLEQVDSMVMAAAYCREWLPRHRNTAVESDVGPTAHVATPTSTAGPLGFERLRLPVFCVSSVLGGEGLDLFRSCLSHLQSPPSSPLLGPSSWAPKPPFEVLLDSAFAVDGVGHVVRGRVTRGPVEVGCSCYIGPGSDGSFYPVFVRGIHVDGGHVNAAQAGDEATFALHRLPDAVTVSHKGKVLVRQPETVVRSFQATVLVLSQSISTHMEPIMYTRNARQAVCVTAVTSAGREEKSGVAADAAGKCERVVVQCRFLFRPEVISAGDALVLQWAPRGIAVGRVTSLESPAEV